MTPDDHEVMDLIRQTLPPVREPASPVDLWPRLVARLGAGRAGPGRLDWALAGLAATLLAGFPEAVLLVLYHL